MTPLSNLALATVKRTGYGCIVLSLLFDLIVVALLLTMTMRTASWALFLENYHLNPWVWMGAIILNVLWSIGLMTVYILRYLPHQRALSEQQRHDLAQWRQARADIHEYLVCLDGYGRPPSLHDYRVLYRLAHHR